MRRCIKQFNYQNFIPLKKRIYFLANRLIRPFSLFRLAPVLLGACGGSGGGDAPPIISAPTAIDTPSAQFLYANFADFAGAEETSFVIDTATGQIRHFDDDTALIGFLNKQPDPLIAPLLASETSPYVGLSYLTHDVRPSGTLDFTRQLSSGSYFLFGRSGPIPNSTTTYHMQSRYHCHYCHSTTGDAPALLIVMPAQNNANFTLETDELSLYLPLHLTQQGLQADTASDNHYLALDDVEKPITSWQAFGHFYGPEAEEAGLLLSVQQPQGLLTLGAVGKQ